MSLSINCQACLLLTVRLSEKDQSDLLTPPQWGEILYKFGGAQNLGQILQGSPKDALEQHGVEDELKLKVLALLGRGVGLAMASEKWLRSGVWILGAGDREYPRNLHLLPVESMPPVLFGYGSVEMLEHSSVAIDQRLRSIGEVELAIAVDDLAACTIGMLDESHSRGVILASITSGGQAIGVTYKDLLEYGSAAELRRGIMDGALTIISTRPPGQYDPRPPTYERAVISGLADDELTQHVLQNCANQKPEAPDQQEPPARQLDLEF